MVKLALLWHMHQPYYADPATGEHILPWVRMHGIKDYLGMVALLEEFPRLRVTFNLVPSLVIQLQDFAADQARDRHLELGLKPAADLTADEARWVVANGFHAPFGRMIAPYPRYAELHARREAHASFDAGQLRDLQVWHKLTWMDPDWLAKDPRLQGLVKKGSGFSEDDKQTLRAVELEILRRVLPAYREAAARGQVELSTSPFYHPILPLLCDSDAHQRAHPGSARPRLRFQRPEDARHQIARAVAFHESTFGQRPKGMWPSEGSVSDEAVALVAEAGLGWIATDEDILSRSLDQMLRPEILYRPYRVGPTGPIVLFRDHGLSDRIGFTYQSWNAIDAARDFVTRVRAAGDGATVSVILDGENAWEHYDGGGRPFLRALYSELSAASDIQTVTMSTAAEGPAITLPSIFPGSWIHGDFYIWIGHRDDHRAWTQLAEARRTFDERSGSVPDEARARAFESLLIAEGSDWFWWYGDDHSSDHDHEFDDLFRRHLRNAYVALGLEPPDELFRTNITTGRTVDGRIAPGPPFEPTLDGRETSFLEWASAACPPFLRPAATMHEVSSSLATAVRIGCGRSAIHLRLDGAAMVRQFQDEATLTVLLTQPVTRSVMVTGVVAVDVVETSLSFADLGVQPGDLVSFAIQIRDRSGQPIETLPQAGAWTLEIPRTDAGSWSA